MLFVFVFICGSGTRANRRLQERLAQPRALPRRQQQNLATHHNRKPRRLHGRLNHRLVGRPDLWRLLPGKPYIDRGISGQTTPQMLIRFRPDVIALKPRVVVILAGTNDLAGNTGPTTLEAIEDNLMSMAELARANSIKTVFASVLPISDYEERDGKSINQSTRRPPEKIRALNEWIRAYAAQNKL